MARLSLYRVVAALAAVVLAAQWWPRALPAPPPAGPAGPDGIVRLRRASAAARRAPRAARTTNGTRGCGPPLFVVHWTHVPKAGGTAFARVARRAACAANPRLAADNPCCVDGLCLGPTCESPGRCPLVMAQGVHTAAMQRLATTGRCGYDWFSTTSSLRAALGEEARSGEAARNASLAAWPLASRARFYGAAGVPLARIDADVRDFARTHDGRGLLAAASAAAERPPCGGDAARGAHSLTVVRHPFARAVSAFYYRGHSPNYDVFDLRPGLWVRPWIKRADVNLREYLALPEYANVLTKMFGATCPRDATCAESASCGCSRTQRCHAYRNASLGEAHVAAAVANLRAHRAFGVQEAFNASARLAGAAFGFAVESRDLRPDRPSAALAGRCSPSRVMRSDPAACRAAFAGHALDVRVFEAAHREFCGRLEAAGLRPAADAELARAGLCGELRHDDADAVCGPLEAPAALARLEELRRPCRKDGAWWALKHGFHSTA